MTERPHSPYLVEHPDDLIEGRRYAIRYYESERHGCAEKFTTGVFKQLMRVRSRLVVIIKYQPDGFSRSVKEHVPWRDITRIEEMEQT